jgi:hypothetical protein
MEHSYILSQLVRDSYAMAYSPSSRSFVTSRTSHTSHVAPISAILTKIDWRGGGDKILSPPPSIHFEWVASHGITDGLRVAARLWLTRVRNLE